MIYIYDILLNFNDDLYEFFEWEKGDNILHIKKIPIIKVNSFVLDDLINKDVQLSNNFLNIINNKTEVYENKRIKVLKYCCLITDGYKVIGININNNIKYSDLLLDEAMDSIEISKRTKTIDIEYTIIGDKQIDYFNTRNEIKIKNYLRLEINNIYNNKDYSKLKYLYFEYFDNNIDNIELIYNELMKSLNKITNKHNKLYQLLKLCNKKASNLTK